MKKEQAMAVKPLTEEEFATVIKVINGVYRRENYHLIAFLRERIIVNGAQLEEAQKDEYGTAANIVREALWDAYTYEGISATVTYKAFKAIGRENECDPRWA